MKATAKQAQSSKKGNGHRPISVLIVSDHHIVRSGLRKILEPESQIHIFGDLDIEQALAVEIMPGQYPDLILIDLNFSNTDAHRFTEDFLPVLKRMSSVLVLSDLADHELARKALMHGATNIVLKMQPAAVLIAAIKDACSNARRDSFQNDLTRGEVSDIPRIVKVEGGAPPEMRKIHRLTAREREIIALVGLGLKNKDIANRLSISDITVRHHLTSIFCKLEVRDRQKLLILAHRNGLTNLMSNTEPA